MVGNLVTAAKVGTADNLAQLSRFVF
jgi:hypothetical protein